MRLVGLALVSAVANANAAVEYDWPEYRRLQILNERIYTDAAEHLQRAGAVDERWLPFHARDLANAESELARELGTGEDRVYLAVRDVLAKYPYVMASELGTYHPGAKSLYSSAFVEAYVAKVRAFVPELADYVVSLNGPPPKRGPQWDGWENHVGRAARVGEDPTHLGDVHYLSDLYEEIHSGRESLTDWTLPRLARAYVEALQRLDAFRARAGELPASDRRATMLKACERVKLAVAWELLTLPPRIESEFKTSIGGRRPSINLFRWRLGPWEARTRHSHVTVNGRVISWGAFVDTLIPLDLYVAARNVYGGRKSCGQTLGSGASTPDP